MNNPVELNTGCWEVSRSGNFDWIARDLSQQDRPNQDPDNRI
jgi:hypothetical protein